MRVAGVFVNYRTSELSLKAARVELDELNKLGSAHIFMVDNDSGDGSAERMTAAAADPSWNGQLTVIAAPRNGGYGYGVNVAVREALRMADPPEYIHVMNTDAFPEPGSLEKLLKFIDTHPEAGIVGGIIQNQDGIPQGGAFRFHSVWSELERGACLGVLSKALDRYIVSPPPPTSNIEVDWLAGTSLLVRREVFEAGVFFDEDFFLYFEEVDFARQVWAAGYRAYYVHDAPMTHIGSYSTGLSNHKPLPLYCYDSRHLYFAKHHGRKYAIACDAAWVMGHLIFRLKNLALRRNEPLRPRMLRDFVTTSVKFLRGSSAAA
jgi:N-acetylglucosaminyl-diphospho-decaprenol L-rhamnosyltransferase